MLLIYQRVKKREAGRARSKPDTCGQFHLLYPIVWEELDCKYHVSGFRGKKCQGNREKDWACLPEMLRAALELSLRWVIPRRCPDALLKTILMVTQWGKELLNLPQRQSVSTVPLEKPWWTCLPGPRILTVSDTQLWGPRHSIPSLQRNLCISYQSPHFPGKEEV